MTTSEAEAQPLLIDEDTFLTCGVHIGTKQKSKDMQPYITTVRDDGLRLLDVSQTSQQIRIAAEFLNSFEPVEILVVSARQYGWKPARRFAVTTGVTCIPGRFTPVVQGIETSRYGQSAIVFPPVPEIVTEITGITVPDVLSGPHPGLSAG